MRELVIASLLPCPPKQVRGIAASRGLMGGARSASEAALTPSTAIVAGVRRRSLLPYPRRVVIRVLARDPGQEEVVR